MSLVWPVLIPFFPFLFNFPLSLVVCPPLPLTLSIGQDFSSLIRFQKPTLLICWSCNHRFRFSLDKISGKLNFPAGLVILEGKGRECKLLKKKKKKTKWWRPLHRRWHRFIDFKREEINWFRWSSTAMPHQLHWLHQQHYPHLRLQLQLPRKRSETNLEIHASIINPVSISFIHISRNTEMGNCCLEDKIFFFSEFLESFDTLDASPANMVQERNPSFSKLPLKISLIAPCLYPSFSPCLTPSFCHRILPLIWWIFGIFHSCKV